MPETQSQSDEVNYVVMPPLGRKPVETSQHPQAQSPEVGAPFVRKWFYIAGAVLLVLLLALLWYFRFANQDETDQPIATQTRLPRVWLNQHFGSEVCANDKICGDTADPDADGLSNFNEFKEGTDPKNSDTDMDGLADSDELTVFKTDPNLKYTDRREIAATNDYNDAVSIANGYDPLTPGFRMTKSRLAQIEADTKQHQFHEPTISTLQTLRPEAQPAPTPTSLAPVTASRQNCGVVEGLHLLAERDKLTAVESNSLNCIDQAMISCLPAKISVHNTLESTKELGNSEFEVIGKVGGDCRMKNDPQAPTQLSPKRTCGVPLAFIANLDKQAKAQPTAGPGIVFFAVSIGMSFGELTDSATGEKITFSCA